MGGARASVVRGGAGVCERGGAGAGRGARHRGLGERREGCVGLVDAALGQSAVLLADAVWAGARLEERVVERWDPERMVGMNIRGYENVYVVDLAVASDL